MPFEENQKLPASGKETGNAKVRPAHWMVPKSISVKDYGTSNVLIVVPHGHPRNDINAEKLGRIVVDKLDAYAVVNNQAIRRPRTNSDGELLENPDRAKGILDLNDSEQVEQCKEEYLDPILLVIKEINESRNEPALVFFVHGISDENADDCEDHPDIIIGKGYTDTYDSEKASGSEPFFTELLNALSDKEMGTVRDNIGAYSGETKLPPHLRRLCLENGLNVEAVQIEFRKTGYRDNPENRKRRGREFSEVIASLSQFNTWKEEEMARGEKKESKVQAPPKTQAPEEPAAQAVQEVAPAAPSTVVESAVSASPEPQESSPSVEESDVLKDTVNFIIEHYTKVAENYELIGERVFEDCFQNDPKKVASHNPKKESSFRTLCEHPQLPVAASTLHNMVRLVVDRGFLQGQGVDVEALGRSRRIELLRLPDKQDKVELAKAAISEELSVRQLRDRSIALANRLALPASEIPRLPNELDEDPLHFLGNKRLMEFIVQKENLQKLKAEKRERLKVQVSALRARVAELGNQLETAERLLEEISSEE